MDTVTPLPAGKRQRSEVSDRRDANHTTILLARESASRRREEVPYVRAIQGCPHTPRLAKAGRRKSAARIFPPSCESVSAAPPPPQQQRGGSCATYTGHDRIPAHAAALAESLQARRRRTIGPWQGCLAAPGHAGDSISGSRAPAR
ncbi:hypothetical protein HPB47_010711 [Ixodes persulcatus]|uniref:Uncharacterized protein n=1 Tax=Ixodes persulcatus TaxID=34615 RepID=A0AC60NYC3_IXOPE|nr:hypothetical protein HPB47_010711 [Ixodes persulcatus]